DQRDGCEGQQSCQGTFAIGHGLLLQRFPVVCTSPATANCAAWRRQPFCVGPSRYNPCHTDSAREEVGTSHSARPRRCYATPKGRSGATGRSPGGALFPITSLRPCAETSLGILPVTSRSCLHSSARFESAFFSAFLGGRNRI